LRDGSRPRRGLTLLVVAGLVSSFLLAAWQLTRPRDLEVTVMFTRVVGLYEGDQVRVLGVPVGEVTKVTRTDDAVEVAMRIDRAVDVPASASAVLIAPSLVSGRYVQLTPAYTSGAKLATGGVIPLARSAVPVEWDELSGALNRLAVDLGPDRADGSGPLGRALTTAAANVDGQGQSMRDTLQALSAATTTLSDSRGDIFGTVRNLAQFTQMLAQTDSQVRDFSTQMADLTGQLAASRTTMASTVKKLNVVLPQVKDFVAQNRPLLRDDLNGLNTTTTLLAAQRQNIADILQTAPTTISNSYNLYDPNTQSSTGALALPYYQSPGQVLCFLLNQTGSGSACTVLAGVFKILDGSAAGTGTPAPGLATMLAGGS
jgi:phospholipid/cholesterol/gamma-HCH transport system substrate-binding protein